MIEQIENWKKQLLAIQQEIDIAVKSDWDGMIQQDIASEPVTVHNVLCRESVRFRRHIVQLLDSIDDNFELCMQVEERKLKI
jgi:hypothetical protein